MEIRIVATKTACPYRKIPHIDVKGVEILRLYFVDGATLKIDKLTFVVLVPLVQ
jgi:hypothetical protein